MKKSLVLLAVLGCYSQSSLAATTFNLNNLAAGGLAAAQADFRLLSEDFGAAMSYKPVTPAAALGITGFDIGVEVSGTDISKSATAWNTLTGTTSPKTLPVPKLTIAKGLPFGIDISAFYTAIPTTNIKLTGAALSYAILEGDALEPALAVRAAMTNLSGISEFSFSTRSLDVSFSKGFVGFTPYIGAGQVWVDSSTSNATLTTLGLKGEAFTQSKVFAGFNINLGLPNFAIEADQTGGIATYSAKLGFRW
ncbi:MAG: hypothetical protein FD173_2009 [Gallionellaceae bacterium]|nr:MAG: hypothetical protein FD173_2009 [Gallionellaceae bacterium]